MFNVGAPEILVILVVALVVLGPNRLPEAGRQLGRALGEFRKIRATVQQDLREVLDVDDLREAFDVRSMLDDRPTGRSTAPAAGAAGAGAASPGSATGKPGYDDIPAPDGAPDIADVAFVATPTLDVPPPPDPSAADPFVDGRAPAAAPVAAS